MPVTSDWAKSDNKSDCDRAGASLIFFSKFIAGSEAEREEKAARGGADMCLYKPIPKVFCLFKYIRDLEDKIEGKTQMKW